MTYKVTKKVSLPKAKFPFSSMKKGDSFLEKNPSRVNTLKVSAYNFAKSKNDKVKFSIRKVDGGYRCFRIK